MKPRTQKTKTQITTQRLKFKTHNTELKTENTELKTHNTELKTKNTELKTWNTTNSSLGPVHRCVLPNGGYVNHKKVRLSGEHLSEHDSNHPLPTSPPPPHLEELF